MFLAALTLFLASPLQEPAGTWRIRVFEDSSGLRPAVGAVVRPWFGTNVFEGLGEPLPEAVVDERGEARVDLSLLERFAPIDLRRGRLHATVHQLGYRLQHVEAQLAHGELLHVEEVETLNLWLPRGWCGRVLDAAGRPVRGAEVFIRHVQGAAGRWSPKHRVATDGQGVFEIEGFTDHAETLEAFHPRHGSASLEASPDGSFATLRLSAQQQPVRGRVVGERGEALPGLLVRGSSVVQRDHPIRSFEFWTDADGTFELHLPTACPWSLRAVVAALDLPHNPAQIVNPGGADVILFAQGIFAWLRVFDPAGRATRAYIHIEPVVDAADGLRPIQDGDRLRARWADRQRPWLDGPDGSLVGFAGPGLFAVQASGRTLAGARFEVRKLVHLDGSRDLERVDLYLRESLPEIPLEIRDALGAELPSFSAFIYCAETGFQVEYLTEQGVPFRSCMAPTYSPVEIAPGSYRLRMLWPGSGLPSEHRFEVSPGEPALLRIPSPILGGRLAAARSAPSGALAEGLILNLWRVGDGLASGPWQLKIVPPHKLGPVWIWSPTQAPDASRPSILLPPGAWDFFLRDAQDVLLQHGRIEIVADKQTLVHLDV